MPEKILVIDDEEINLILLDKVLRSWGFEVVSTANAVEAPGLLPAHKFALALVDLKMPGLDGVQVMEELKKADPEIDVIIMTAFGSIESAVAAVKKGALNYITKPLDMEHLKILLTRAIKDRHTRQEIENLKSYAQERASFGGIIGASPAMTKVYRTIEKVAQTDASVLILGETGTGKELVARAIHINSPRRDKRFVPLTCSALPENLMESELFGYEAGAFTGADKRKTGLIEYGNEGTLFLDEIADISPGTQMKLLRVLQEHELNRIGSPAAINVNIRLISATNKNLQEEIKTGRFREDLFYRINVVTLELPPLRERRDDIPILAQHFLDKLNASREQKIKNISLEAMIFLIQYHWPGNVRELENAIARAVALDADNIIKPYDLPEQITAGLSKSRPDSAPALPLKQFVEKTEKEYLVGLLKTVQGNANQAIGQSGLSHATFYEKLKKHRINLAEYRT